MGVFFRPILPNQLPDVQVGGKHADQRYGLKSIGNIIGVDSMVGFVCEATSARHCRLSGYTTMSTCVSLQLKDVQGYR